MDYDHPLKGRPNWRLQVSILAVLVGAIGAWVCVQRYQATARQSLTAAPISGVVVGYEMMGGAERLRVFITRDNGETEFVALTPDSAAPRYSRDETLQLLPIRSMADDGRYFEQLVVFDPKAEQRRNLIGMAMFLAIATLGIVGAVRYGSSRRQAGQADSP